MQLPLGTVPDRAVTHDQFANTPSFLIGKPWKAQIEILVNRNGGHHACHKAADEHAEHCFAKLQHNRRAAWWPVTLNTDVAVSRTAERPALTRAGPVMLDM